MKHTSKQGTPFLSSTNLYFIYVNPELFSFRRAIKEKIFWMKWQFNCRLNPMRLLKLRKK